MRAYIVEFVSAANFYRREWEGHVVEEIVRLSGARTTYRIAITKGFLIQALERASKRDCEIFHLSCHGNDEGICLTNGERLSWDELAEAFDDATYDPDALILSSCLGGEGGAARAFFKKEWRPSVIFGSESNSDKLTFSGACISWPILYTELVQKGMGREVFQHAVDKMNSVTNHEFVYWRWDADRYRRYPARNT